MTDTTKSQRGKLKTFRLSNQTLKSIEKISKKFSETAGTRIAMSKIIEIAIFSIENKSFSDLLKLK